MNDVSNTIKELEYSLLTSEVRGSREVLDALLADDFAELGSSGNRYTKVDILERLPVTVNHAIYKVSDFVVQTPSEGIAIATFTTKNSGGRVPCCLKENVSLEKDRSRLADVFP